MSVYNYEDLLKALQKKPGFKLAFTYLKSTIKTPEQCVKYVQS